MKQSKAWLSGALMLAAVYGAFLVWQLPALQLYGWFAPKLANQLQLAGVQGRLWQGSAATASIQGFVVDEVQWEFQPLALLTGKLSWQLRAAAKQSLRLSINPLTQAVSLEQVQLSLNASELRQWLPPLMQSVELEGLFKLQDLQLVWTKTGLERLAGKLDWHNAAFSSPFAKGKLGGISITLSGDSSSGLKAKLKDLSGQLGVEGEGQLTPAGLWSFKGESKALNQLPADTVNLLRLIGQPLADGRLSFNSQGHFPWPGAVVSTAPATAAAAKP